MKQTKIYFYELNLRQTDFMPIVKKIFYNILLIYEYASYLKDLSIKS